MQHRIGVQRTTRAGRRRGTATVEFAAIAPVLVVLVLGTIEVTRALQVKQYVVDAARYGARLASRPGTDSSEVSSAVAAVLSQYDIPSSSITTAVKVNGVTADASTAATGASVTVQVSVPLSEIAWITPVFLSSDTVVSEPLTMVRH